MRASYGLPVVWCVLRRATSLQVYARADNSRAALGTMVSAVGIMDGGLYPRTHPMVWRQHCLEIGLEALEHLEFARRMWRGPITSVPTSWIFEGRGASHDQPWPLYTDSIIDRRWIIFA